MTAAPAPLDGIRVVDLTRFVSGSYAAQLMAAMGAEVIKIEVPPNGDPYRSQGTVRVEGHSVLFMTLNTGKKSVALDFRAAEAAPHMERLLASADVLLENARPGLSIDIDSTTRRFMTAIPTSSTDQSPVLATLGPMLVVVGLT